MNPRNVWPAVVLAGTAMVVVGVMAFLKVDKDTIFLVSGTFVVPVLAALLAAQVAETKAATQAVQQQTNGNTTKLMEMIEAQGKMLAQMHPPAAGLAVPPTSDEPPPPADVPAQ